MEILLNVFIDVPPEKIKERLKKRNTETDEQIKLRNERIELESRLKDKFDYIIDNSGGLGFAVDELKKIINKYNQP
jgi:guanylate kinase